MQLTAEDDQMLGLERTYPPEKEISQLFSSQIASEVIDGKIGLITIRGFMPTLGDFQPAKQFSKQIEELNSQNIEHLIIDVRGNGGGLDALVPKMVGHFVQENGFYEYISFYNDEINDFEIEESDTLEMNPQEPYFGGDVIVLIDNYSVSTAEGIPLLVQKYSLGKIVGIYGTNGSFAAGVPGQNLFQLPEGLVFSFLGGRSMDEEMNIQVDSNAAGVGGVQPDIRVELTIESVYAMSIEGRDIVLEKALSLFDE